MVRVAGLKRRDEMGLSVRSADGLSPREQLRRIGERTQQLASRQARVFLDEVRPALAEEGILVVGWSEIDEDEQSRLSTYFHEQVFPVLTPLAVDPAHPFPFVSGLSLNLAITVRQPEDGTTHFARIKVPDNVDRFVELKGDGTRGRPPRRAVPADGGTHRRVPAGVVPGPGDRRAPRVPDHPQRRHGGRGGPRRRPAAGPRTRTRAPPVRIAGPPGGRRRHDREHARAAAARTRRASRRRDRGARSARPVVAVAALRAGPARPSRTARSCPRHRRRSANAKRPRVFSRRCATATFWCTTPTTRSPPPCNASSSRPPRTRTCWRSSRPCTGPRATRRSSTRSSTPPRPASRWWRWSRSRPGSTSRPTSSGHAHWSRPACTWSTGSSVSRRTARRVWWCGAKVRRSGATAISAPATTTRRPPGSTRTSAC